MSRYFALMIWRGVFTTPRPARWRRWAGLLLVGLGLPLLVGMQAPPCSEANATFLVRRMVERQQPSNGAMVAVPVGMAVGWSCTSAADAEQAWQAEADRMGR